MFSMIIDKNTIVLKSVFASCNTDKSNDKF